MNLYPAGKALTYFMVRLFFKMEYEGLEYIPKERGFILASNHRSNFDPLFVAHKVPAQLHYMAKIELFRNKLVGWVLRSLGAFPVARGEGDGSAMERAADIVKDGEILAMFPEGHRSKDGKPLRPRSGIGVVAAQTGADVLPCAVQFGERLRFRCRVTVRYGKLIPNSDLGVNLENPRTMRTASKRIMDAIVSMLDLPEETE